MKQEAICKTIIAIAVAMAFVMPVAAFAKDEKAMNNESSNITNTETFDFTHTVFAEYATSTTCSYCKYAHAALKTIYASGDYPFYYVSLVCNKNSKAYTRAIADYNIIGYPTVFFDGGYKVNLGGSTGSEAQYRSSIASCGDRAVYDVDIDLKVTWLDGTEMKINVSVDNNESNIYNGTIRVYITEIESSMGWKDAAGYLYTFPFLDWAFNEEISIPAGGTWGDSTTWNGSAHGYPSVTKNNIMIMAAVFNDEFHMGYADPPLGSPFAAYYVDETTAAIPNGDNMPPNKPNIPSGQIRGKIGVDYAYTSNTMDPDEDDVYYLFDWGDGTDTGWLGPYNSGENVTTSYNWTTEGDYEIKVKAKDIHGDESSWSDPLSVTMPQNQGLFISFFDVMEHYFPRLFSILNVITGGKI